VVEAQKGGVMHSLIQLTLVERSAFGHYTDHAVHVDSDKVLAVQQSYRTTNGAAAPLSVLHMIGGSTLTVNGEDKDVIAKLWPEQSCQHRGGFSADGDVVRCNNCAKTVASIMERAP